MVLFKSYFIPLFFLISLFNLNINVEGDPVYALQSLNKVSGGYDGTAKLTQNSGPFPPDVENITFTVRYVSKDIVHIKLVDSNNKRYEVPDVLKAEDLAQTPSDATLQVTFTQSPFGFAVTRTSNNEVLFNSTSSNSLIFEKQFLQISSQVGENIYGMGEHANPLRLQQKTYTLFNKDVGGVSADRNLYGSHPFYLELRNSQSHGVFLLNSNPMDVIVGSSSSSSSSTSQTLTYKTIGGIFDFYFFSGTSPSSVISQYLSLFGPVYMPPFWALGWHQCRYGYHTIQQTMDVVQNYASNNIPLDTMWNDIDYMNEYRDWTLDPVNFPTSTVQEFVDNLHENGQQYIVIVDPGIKVEQGYSPYDDGLKKDLFIKEQDGKTPLLGYVWPGYTNYPDFTHPNTSEWWAQSIQEFHEQGPAFDGLWIDMNEVSNFCDGECNTGGSTSIYDNPPYVPGGVALNQTTINLSSVQYSGITYDLHNLYGLQESKATKEGLEKVRGKRAVVISRSNYAGSGTHAGHWLGDNTSTFTDLYQSIPGILAMNMFGIPLVGADICGFHSDTTEELCSRWMQLGSFYPFSRNHNDLNSISQEPYVFSQQHLEISKNALLNRYSLLNYYYSLFFLAHYQGETVVRPLFFEFPSDSQTYGIDRQFLLGPGLMISPVLEQGATTVEAYFPDAKWYTWEDGTLVESGTHTLSAPITKIPTHVRGGYIIPLQDPSLTSKETRLNPFKLLVPLDKDGNASGFLYLDDGESLSVGEQATIISYLLDYSDNTYILSSSLHQNSWTPEGNAKLGTVTVYGIPSSKSVQEVIVNQSTLPSSSWTIKDNNVLEINNLSLEMTQPFKVIWLVQ